MLMKKPEHKRFEYIPRYYNPDKDESQKFKERFDLIRRYHIAKKKNYKLFLYFLIIILIMYIAIKIGII